MRRSLQQLLIDDLMDLANLDTDVVASEEAIRFMMARYQQWGILKNTRIVKKSDFAAIIDALDTAKKIRQKTIISNFLLK